MSDKIEFLDKLCDLLDKYHAEIFADEDSEDSGGKIVLEFNDADFFRFETLDVDSLYKLIRPSKA